MRQPIDAAAAWHAADVADPRAWTIELTDEQRAELARLARDAHQQGRTPATLGEHQVRIDSLGPVVRRIVEALTTGHGFVLLRRFPTDQLAPEETELAYFALGLQLGTPVSQDAAGTLLGHVRDERVERTGPEVRLYRTSERQDFHTDGADIIGLLCLHAAAAGGESKLASSYAGCGGTATANRPRATIPRSRFPSSTTSKANPGCSSSGGTSGTPNVIPRSHV